MVNYFKEPGIIETFFCKMRFLTTVCFRMKENTKDILLDFILNFFKLSPMINEARMTMLDTMGEEQIFIFPCFRQCILIYRVKPCHL
jgi:hypothetical protein